MAGPVARLIWEKDGRDPLSKKSRGFPESDPVTGTGWKFHFETIAIEMVIGLEGLDNHKVDRHPDGTAPV